MHPIHDTGNGPWSSYVHTDPITDFRILVILEAIFQVWAFKFGTIGALNRLINRSPGFWDNRKILFLEIV